MGRQAGKAALFEAIAATGKALSNGKRLELLDLLAQGERSVEALGSAAGIALTTVSGHLQTLKQAGLVTTRREGTRIYYRLAGPDVTALYGSLLRVADSRQATAERARRAYLGPDDTEVLTRDGLLARLKAGTAVVIDVRPDEEFRAGHIPGAISIPLDDLEGRLSELADAADIVAYCRGANCVLAHDAVRLLARHGRRARRLEEGMVEWRLADLPVVAGRTA